MDSVLAYGHHGWPCGEPMLARNGQRDGQGCAVYSMQGRGNEKPR